MRVETVVAVFVNSVFLVMIGSAGFLGAVLVFP